MKSFVDFIPVCPEVEIGLGILRATLRIVRIEGVDHLIQPATGRNVTNDVASFWHLPRPFQGSKTEKRRS